MENLYFDTASTTKVFPEVIEKMESIYRNNYANSASVHLQGQDSASILEDSREKMADFIGAEKAEEIIFTAGGTEADNLAVKGIAMALSDQGKHIITSAFEHQAVLKSCEFLKKHLGFEITYLGVDQEGFVSAEELRENIREDTVLISIMYANNEVGTIQKLEKLVQIAKENNIIFHTDAVQAAGQLKINVAQLGVDALSLSAHKFNGPKGIGLLFLRSGIELVPQMSGGSQERKRRAGTVNLPAVVGMAEAAEITEKKLAVKQENLLELRDYLVKELRDNFTDLKINGPFPNNRLAANVNVSFKNLEADSILFNLSLNDIDASTGSACASGSLGISHVLKALNLEAEYKKGALRFTLSDSNNKDQIDFLIKKLKDIVARLRSLK